MSVVRGRPPGLAGGMSGSNRRNWSSVSAWPEPKSPTSARSAGVHMAVSRRKPPATPPQGPGSARRTKPPIIPSQTGSDPPPLKWSALKYGFEPEEDRDDGQEAQQPVEK